MCKRKNNVQQTISKMAAAPARAYHKGIGLVNAVLRQAELLPHCERVAGEILSRGPVAVRMALEAAIRGLETDLEHGLEQEAAFFGLVSATDDMREGMRAFLEKRKPAFKGA